MRNRIIAFALILLMFAFPLAVSAADMDYEGELDDRTGEPKGKSGNDDELVRVYADVYYDRIKKAYVYDFAEGKVYLNVPADIATTQTVSVSFDEGLKAKIYRDSKELINNDTTSISAAGSYVIMFNDDAQKQIRFTILGKRTGLIYDYTVPNGFEIASVLYNGEYVTFSGRTAGTEKEGDYTIEYRCINTDMVYSVQFTVDHTPPVLKLENVIDGHAKGKVDISDLEDGARILIKLNGNEIPYSKELIQNGSYEITVADAAGNLTVYSFVIDIYFNFNSIIFIVIVAALIAALIAYLVMSRKKHRIR